MNKRELKLALEILAGKLEVGSAERRMVHLLARAFRRGADPVAGIMALARVWPEVFGK